jgi:hypothetical protein
MTTEFQHEQEERRETLLNDARVREQQRGATLSGFAQAEANIDRGRFTANEKSTVVGASPIPQYPAAFQQRDPVPDEPALGVDLNALEPCGEPHELKASIAAQDAPSLEPSPFSAQGNCGDPTAAPSTKSPGDVESVGSPPFLKE